MKYDLLGIGNALVDIEVCVDDEFIKQNSLTKGRDDSVDCRKAK